jgi:drug/metabolite transporter (DMT)-like permease
MLKGDLRLERWKGPVCLFFAFTLAGTSVIAARLVSGKLGAFTIAAASLSFALLFLLPAGGKKLMESLRAMPAKDLLFLVLQAVFGIFLFRIFLLYGLLFTSAGEAGILTGATPAITALLAMALLKEPANKKKLAGISATVGGILMIQGLVNSGNDFTWEHWGGNMLVLCAAASESAFNIFSRVSAINTAPDHRRPVGPLVQTTLVAAIALLFCLIPAMFESPWQRLAAIGLTEWLALLWYGLFVTALAFVFWYAGIKRCGAFTAAAFSGMVPFTSLLLSVFLLGERAGWRQWSGGVLVILGMALIGTGDIPDGAPLSVSGPGHSSQPSHRA